MLPGAFVYQLKKKGPIKLIAGTLFFWIAGRLASWSIFGFIIAILIGGYFAAYAIKIINAVATGGSELPEWPDFTDIWDSIISPFLFVLAVGGVAFAPAIIYGLFLLPRGAPHVLLPVFTLWGVLYLPMGFLAIAIHNNIAALDPIFVMVSIFRVFGRYMVLWLLFVLLAVAEHLVKAFLGFIPFVSTIVTSFLTLYILTIEMRLLGLIYFTGQKKLRWD